MQCNSQPYYTLICMRYWSQQWLSLWTRFYQPNPWAPHRLQASTSSLGQLSLTNIKTYNLLFHNNNNSWYMNECMHHHIKPHNCLYSINKILSYRNHTSQPKCHQNTTVKHLAIILAMYHINSSTTETQHFAKRFIILLWKLQQKYAHDPNLIILTPTTTI